MFKTKLFACCMCVLISMSMAGIAFAGRTTRDLVFEEEPEIEVEINEKAKAEFGTDDPTVVSVKATIELNRGGEKSTVLSSAEFKSGDKVKILYTPSVDAYVYWMSQGTSGKYYMLFPNPKTGTDNFVKKNEVHSIPTKGSFRFDDKKGTEKILLVLASAKIPELEKAAQEAAISGGKISASATEINNLSTKQESKRTTRDLVFEEDEDEESGIETQTQASKSMEPMIVYYELIHN